MENYDKLVEKISSLAKVSKEDIERKVEAKRAKLSGLVSKEGAAQIVAAELGLNLDQEKLKISELVHGMKRANVIGKIIRTFPIREYEKNGKQGKVANLMIADSSGNARLVLWDTNHIGLVEQGKVKEGSVVEISNAGIRNGEIHLSSFSDIKLSKEAMADVVTEKSYSSKKFSEVSAGQNLKIRAFVVQTFEPRFFEVCPRCGKKAVDNECKEHGKVEAKKRALLNVVLDDGNETMRAVLFSENINKLGLTDEEIFSMEGFEQTKKKILGEEKIFSGNIRQNQFFNNIEFSVESIEDVNSAELIKELEAKH
jgi:replication factor A1